jgi:hypothetical protein
MQIEPVRYYKISLDPGEHIQLAAALWHTRRLPDPGQPWDWTDSVLVRIGAGEPLDAIDADAVRREITRYCRDTCGPGEPWPPALDDIASQLLVTIP